MADKLEKRSSSVPAMNRESQLPGRTEMNIKGDLSPSGDVLECAVCLQTCIHPVILPCSHIFCFLCVKGAANQIRRCALCRQDIPVEYFNNPTLVGKEKEPKALDLETEADHYSWFYEGRNGWWQYDERTNVELEESYNAKKRSFDLLIAGYMYIIDLDNMLQMRRHDQSRRRRIKRDLVSAPKKGIAGLKIAAHQDDSETTEEKQVSEPEKSDTAAGGSGAPLQESAADQSSVMDGGVGETKRRTAGVGRDAFANADQYDADDDGSDDDVERAGTHRETVPQRSRPERRGHTNQQPAPQTTRPSSRRNPHGLTIQHQRVSSAPEINQGRRSPQTALDNHSVDPQQEHVDPQQKHVDPQQEHVDPQQEHVDPQQERVDPTSAMRSLQISTPDEVVYEVSTVPIQPPQRAVRQRRNRQRHNDDVAL